MFFFLLLLLLLLPLTLSRSAGHMIGGSIWDIGTDADTLVYSMNINPLPDNHLHAASITVDRNISMLITDVCEDTTNTMHDYGQEENARYLRFSNLITRTLEDNRGNVLIPVDSAGRCLEVLLLLERVWEEKRFDSFKVYFLTKRNTHLLKYVRSISSLLNNRNQDVRNEREAFDLRHIICAHAVEIIPESGCKVVVASMEDLETSFSQLILNKWCSKQENLLLFVSSPAPDTLAWRILHQPQEHYFPFVVSDE